MVLLRTYASVEGLTGYSRVNSSQLTSRKSPSRLQTDLDLMLRRTQDSDAFEVLALRPLATFASTIDDVVLKRANEQATSASTSIRLQDDKSAKLATRRVVANRAYWCRRCC